MSLHLHGARERCSSVEAGPAPKRQKLSAITREQLEEAFKSIPQTNPVPETSIILGKDRYSNILPYPACRVELDDGVYINASRVLEDPESKETLIATQGPLEETVPDFFAMANKTNAAAIVIVSNSVGGKGEEKFYKYWTECPVVYRRTTEQNRPQLILPMQLMPPMLHGEYLVKVTTPRQVVHAQEGLNERVATRVLTIIKDRNSRKVKLFSLENWPDQGVVQVNTLAALVKNLYEFMKDRPDKESIICHCSAGVGRTGTALAVYHLYKKMMMDEEYEYEHQHLFETVAEMRSEDKGRHPDMVQRPEQYILAHETLEYLAKEIREGK